MIGTDLWFDTVPFLRKGELDDIAAAKTHLRIAGKPFSGSNIVAALGFGFWTSLLDRHYHWDFNWPHLVNVAFPYVSKYLRMREKVLKRLDDMRHLRNRVFHHEPIWDWPNLSQRHQELSEAINWINPTFYSAVRLLDRFPDIYTAGMQPYSEMLEIYFQNYRADGPA